MAGNAYSDGKTQPKFRDYVFGIGPLGHPIAGVVHDIDKANGKVLITPQVLDAFWVNTSDVTSTPGAPKK